MQSCVSTFKEITAHSCIKSGDVPVHASPSVHYANTFLELRSGQITVVQSARLSRVCFHAPPVGVITVSIVRPDRDLVDCSMIGPP